MAKSKMVVPPEAQGESLLRWLARRGIALPADCAGRGSCGKCRVRVVEGVFLSAEDGKAPLVPDEKGEILACRAVCPAAGASIEIENTEGKGLVEFSGSMSPAGAKTGYGMALDIGTTTLAAALVERASGRVLATDSCLNPQRSFGADVISRIAACQEGRLEEMSACVREKVGEMLCRFANEYPQARPDLLAVAGNTTMLHLFAGISPEGMGTYPFLPAFTNAISVEGGQYGLSIPRVQLLPSASAFIGSDILGGILVSGMLEGEEPAVLMDIGTNGEMALWTGKRHGRLLTASTAAGPALEGARISCGVGGIPGAMDRVRLDSGAAGLQYSTIGDMPVRGICGCGLIDLIAALLRMGLLEESGWLADGEFFLRGTHVSTDGSRILENSGDFKVSLTQRDVREFQLAKSAMRAGLEALVAEAGLKMEEIQRLYIAGGLGAHLDFGSAARVGLLPPKLEKRFVSLGNSALFGAVNCILDDAAIEKLSGISRRCQIVELNASEVFNEAFVEYMSFPESDSTAARPTDFGQRS